MAGMAKDIRYALRTLRRSPGFAIVAILTLGLGIGANTAIFSVINAVLLRPLPFADPDRLVSMTHEYPSLHLQAGVSVPGFLTYDKQKQAFADAGVQTGWAPTLTGHGDPVRLQAVTVAGDYFSTFGVQPILGRALRSDESTAGNEKVVVLSEAFWRGSYGADPAIIGRKLLLNGESYEVVGVMPRRFTAMLNRNTDMWVPLVFTPRQINGSATNEFLGFRARLKDGVSIETAQAEMTALAKRLKSERPDDYSPDWTLRVTPAARPARRSRHAEGDARAPWRRRPGAPHRVRQCRQPAARPRGRALPRDRRSRGARRVARRPHPPAAHRERASSRSQEGPSGCSSPSGACRRSSHSTRGTCRRRRWWGSTRRCSSSPCCCRC